MLKHCHCGKPATVEHQDQLLCTEHAFEKIKGTRGTIERFQVLRKS